MDIATVIGIVMSFGLMIAAILMGGSIMTFVDYPSMMIVFGGTIGATLTSYPLGDVIKVANVIKNTVLFKPQNPSEIIAQLVQYSQVARREGILALESAIEETDDVFFKKAIQLVVDGAEPDIIRDVLETEVAFIDERHKQGAALVEFMSVLAPAFGMIGTLIGLVQMLKTMNDPSTIGPAMAVALITTFYGAVLANVVFLPLANKLRVRSSEEMLIKDLIIAGILSIQAGDNPRVVEQKLHAYVAPKFRESQFT